MNQGKFIPFVTMAFFALVAVILLSNSLFLTIDPGQKGVLFKRFGGGLDKEHVYGQGFHVIAPWNTMFVYDVRIQESLEKMSVLSKNGLTIDVELSYRYHPKPSKIGHLHDGIGPNFHDAILRPEIRSATREVIGKYLPEELYSSKREAIQTEIYDRTHKSVDKNFLNLEAVLIREVALPVSLREAIQRKLKEEQESLQYQYRLDKERQESERKIIEANAKAEANRIISASLTDKILQDKGIEATLELANSPNAKVVIVGGGEGGGLPLILGN